MRLAPAVALLLAACPYVPEGRIEVESGALPIAPGQSLSLALVCDDLFAGWTRVSGAGACGRDWRVQDTPGGADGFGAIDDCGRYVAPAARPPAPVRISAIDCPWGMECTDTCGALLTLGLEGYPAP
jgi:hypothetical protein